MSRPVDNRSVNRPHQVMDGQQQKHPPGGSKFDVIQRIEDSPVYPDAPLVIKFLERLLIGYILFEFWARRKFFVQNRVVNVLGVPHHGKNIFEKMGRMRISFRVAVFMMHTVHDGIRPGA